MTLSLNTIISYAQKGKDIYLPRTTLLLEMQKVQWKPANQSGCDRSAGPGLYGCSRTQPRSLELPWGRSWRPSHAPAARPAGEAAAETGALVRAPPHHAGPASGPAFAPVRGQSCGERGLGNPSAGPSPGRGGAAPARQAQSARELGRAGRARRHLTS